MARGWDIGGACVAAAAGALRAARPECAGCAASAAAAPLPAGRRRGYSGAGATAAAPPPPDWVAVTPGSASPAPLHLDAADGEHGGPAAAPAPAAAAAAAAGGDGDGGLPDRSDSLIAKELQAAEGLAVTPFDCPACLDRIAPSDGISLCGAGHAVCCDCFKDMAAPLIAQRQMVTCPDCGDGVAGWLIQRVLGAEAAAAYAAVEQMHIHDAVAPGGSPGAAEKLWQCPTPDCPTRRAVAVDFDPGQVHAEDGEWTVVDRHRVFHCPGCSKSICVACNMEDHPGVDCGAYQQWREDNAKADEQYSDLVRQGLVKPCPACKMPVLKDGGCNFITCGKCKDKNGMCWQTGKPRRGPGGCGGGHNCH